MFLGNTKVIAQNAFDQMQDAMSSYASPSKNMELMGKVAGSDPSAGNYKYGVFGTTLLNLFLQDTQSTLDAAFNTEKFITDIFTKVGQMQG